MKNARISRLGGCLFLFAALQAQVPQLINFQGRIAVDGVNFNGTGLFKFALVNGDGRATYWSNDGTSANGNEPSNAVSIPVAQGLYSVLLGDPAFTNMTPVPATLFTNSDVRLRIWFNDGTNGFQQLSPDQRIAAVGYAMMAANVADGAVTSAKLADGAVTGGKLAANTVTAANIAPGSIGAAQLSTNAAADSLHVSGGLVLSDVSNATNLLNAGYLRIGQVTTDADYWRQVGVAVPSARANHSAVWTGTEMIIWGGFRAPRPDYLATGERYNPATDTWTLISTNGAPTPRAQPAALWTGTEMIIWGGSTNSTALTNGARYNPVTDSWQAISNAGAPPLGSGFSTVWTGQEMILFGGGSPGTTIGGRYNPAAKAWRPISTNSAPAGRHDHRAVWTGHEMIIWGGMRDAVYLNNGGRYDPANDSWTPTTTTSAPAGRAMPLAVWTGSEMIVWGGLNANGYLNSGSRYRPATDSWNATPLLNAPLPGSSLSAIWSGAQMIVWNGPAAAGARYNALSNTWSRIDANNAPARRSLFSAVWADNLNEMVVWGGNGTGENLAQVLNTGGRYNPVSDTWIPTAASPAGRTNHTAVWTGAEMIVWGGLNNARTTSGFLNTGGRFNPATGHWTPTSLLNAPSPRMGQTAVWTGTEMLVWGGYGPQIFQGRLVEPQVNNDGARYNPARDFWTAMETNSAPVARMGHSAVWTGDEMIVWGGIMTNRFNPQVTSVLNSGGRYNPSLNTWTSISSSSAPMARVQHTAVWTGDEMIIWGGYAMTNIFTDRRYLNTGARYFPNLNVWVATSTNGAPPPPIEHTAVWSGTEMIVWGAKQVGGRYSPASDSWLPISRTGAPNGGPGHSAVWTGNQMIVWGGGTPTLAQDLGGRYDPAADTWVRISTDGMPRSRARHTAVWTGTSMLIFGGADPQGAFPDTTYLYSLTRPMYLYKKP